MDTKPGTTVESEAPRDSGPRCYRFAPFVLRKRATMANFDWKTPANAARLNTSVDQVKSILKKRIGAPELTPEAQRAMWLMFTAAADQQYENARRSALLQHTQQSEKPLDLLIQRLECLKEAIAALPPRSLGVLNKRVVAAQDRPDWRSFDSEVFAAWTEDLISTTPSLRPRRKGMRVQEILRESLPSPFAKAPRTSKSDLIDLWESIPSSTRSAVEAAIRNARPQRSLVKFLQQLISRLEAHRPLKKRMPAYTRHYAECVCHIWDDLGIRVGATNEPGVYGPFQRCCQAALRAFNDHWSIPRGQVVYLQKSAAHIRRKRLKSKNRS